MNPPKQAAAANPNPLPQAAPPKHNHCFKQVILKLLVLLKTEKAFDKFLQVLVVFMLTAKLVDPNFVWNPIDPDAVGTNDITSKAKIPTSMTMLGSHVKVLGNGYPFVKQ
jgi:hypothetical protein